MNKNQADQNPEVTMFLSSRYGPRPITWPAIPTMVVICLFSILQCSCDSPGPMNVFVAVPSDGEGWLWQTFQPPAESTALMNGFRLAKATFAPITYGRECTLTVIVAYYYADHHGITDPVFRGAFAVRTDIADTSLPAWVDFEFGDAECAARFDAPLAFYFYRTHGDACDLYTTHSLDYPAGCLRVQSRADAEPTVIGNAHFAVTYARPTP